MYLNVRNRFPRIKLPPSRMISGRKIEKISIFASIHPLHTLNQGQGSVFTLRECAQSIPCIKLLTRVQLSNVGPAGLILIGVKLLIFKKLSMRIEPVDPTLLNFPDRTGGFLIHCTMSFSGKRGISIGQVF